MAKIKLLTDEWFVMVEKANAIAGELPLSPTMKNICFNILILHNEIDENEESTTVESISNHKSKVNETMHDVSQPKYSMQFVEGKLHLGIIEGAKTTLSISENTLQDLLSTMKMSDAMQEFINGNIQISGDVSQMMAMQTAKMSDEQNALYAMIIKSTEL